MSSTMSYLYTNLMIRMSWAQRRDRNRKLRRVNSMSSKSESVSPLVFNGFRSKKRFLHVNVCGLSNPNCRFPSKVRVRKVPLLPSRRRGKVKPPSGTSSSHAHHHHAPKPGDLYGPEHGSLTMPPPMKREKLSIFEELNGPAGGSDLFDTRFHHPGPPPPFSNF